MRALGTLVLTLVCVGLVTASARRAECVVYGSLDREFSDAAAVFEGRVIAVEWIPGRECCHVLSGHVTIETDRWWKGEPVRQIRIGAVGQIFDLGESYVLFAFGKPLMADGCNSTRRLKESSSTLQWLTRQRVARAKPLSSAATPVRPRELPRFCQDAPQVKADFQPEVDNKNGQKLLALLGLSSAVIGLSARSSDWRNDSEAVTRVTEVLGGKPGALWSRAMWSEGVSAMSRRVMATIDPARAMRIDIAGNHVCVEHTDGRFWFFRTVPVDGWRPR